MLGDRAMNANKKAYTSFREIIEALFPGVLTAEGHIPAEAQEDRHG